MSHMHFMERPPSTAERFAHAFSGLGQTLAQDIPEHLLRQQMQEEENKALFGLTGYDFKGISNPKVRESGGISALKNKQSYAADAANYNTMKEAFGEKFAKVWQASPVGARTKLTAAAVDAYGRQIDIEEALLGIKEEKSDKESGVNADESKGKLPKYKLNTIGMNAPEKVKYKSELRKYNSDIWKENADKYASYKNLGRDIKMLDKLNEKKNLPEGLEKLLINPETGTFYAAATALHAPHKDAQEWVKILARQATQAQSAFPGRVTNFDLQSYMMQFPSLFNTYEGRQGILKMMDLTNKANEIFSKALDDVYRKYKADGITPEDAHAMASDLVRDEVALIDDELVALAAQGENMAKGPESSEKEAGESATVKMKAPNGEIVDIPREMMQEALASGGELVE